MMTPKISIIINSYNYENYIGEAIDSAIDQDYDNKEIIVVDDGSTDNSKDVILSYGDRIIPIFHKNLGQARTCLRAAQSATGDYVYFLDSDDYLLPGAVSAIAAVCAPDVSKVQFQLLPVGPTGETVGKPWPPMSDASRDQLIDRIRLRGTYPTPPTSGNVYRADVLRYVEDIDYEMSIDGIPYLLAPFLGEVRQIARPLGCYRYHSANFSGHGQLSPKRFELEAARHRARLVHLAKIVREYGLGEAAISDSADHSFVRTRDLVIEISNGKRPTAPQYWRYAKSLFREREPIGRRAKLLLWGLALTVTPDKVRRRLAIYRTDPRARPSSKRTGTGPREPGDRSGKAAPTPARPAGPDFSSSKRILAK